MNQLMIIPLFVSLVALGVMTWSIITVGAPSCTPPHLNLEFGAKP